MADECSRIDVYYAQKELASSMQQLREAYADDRLYDEHNVAALKGVCEENAIRLEYALSHTVPSLRGRYALRGRVAEVTGLVSELVREALIARDNVQLLRLLTCRKLMAGLLAKTVHVNFLLSKEEYLIMQTVEEYIQCIKEAKVC